MRFFTDIHRSLLFIFAVFNAAVFALIAKWREQLRVDLLSASHDL